MTKERMSVITDWRVRDEDLPDVAPGEEYVRVITPQQHVVLYRIVVHDLCLVRLVIGAVEIPFKPDSFDVHLRTYRYRPAAPRQLTLHRDNADEIAVMAGMDVRVALRNETAAPAKPRAALLVREEII